MAQLPLETHIYISTLSDLKPGEMLKVDVAPGIYELMGYENGYLFLENTTKLDDIKVVKIFNTRDGDYGMSGTYHNGETSDPNHMRLYNVNICNELLRLKWNQQKCSYEDATDHKIKREMSVYYSNVDSWFMNSEDEEDSFDEYSDEEDSFDEYSDDDDYYDHNSPAKGRRLRKLGEYHNLPVLFYLNREVVDLNKVKMVCEPSAVPANLKYLFAWRVEEDGNFIGYAVRSILHDMMGDQAGVAIYEGAKAFGNFKLWSYKDTIKYAMEEQVFDSRYKYKCSYSPCSCRTSYSE